MTRTPKKLPKPRRVVVLALSPVQLLDVVGPVEVFDIANREAPGAYRIEVAGGGDRPKVRGSSGLVVANAVSHRAVRGPVDTLVVAGGLGARTLDDASVVSWLRRTSARARRTCAVCTGAFALARAGLLDGRRAATHWAHAEELALAFPRVDVQPDPIWVRDGSFYTSAGVTAGMDLALALVAEDLGREHALRVARQLVLYLHRPGGQAQFSALLESSLGESGPIRELVEWMSVRLAQDLSVEALAARAHMSVRNFCRVFAREQGVGPGAFVRRLRLEAARRALEQTRSGVKEIAKRCGFGSEEHLRIAFHRAYGTSPSTYRRAFATTR